MSFDSGSSSSQESSDDNLERSFEEAFREQVEGYAGERLSGLGANANIRRMNALARACIHQGVTCCAIGLHDTVCYVAGNSDKNSVKIKIKLQSYLDDLNSGFPINEEYWWDKTKGSALQGRDDTKLMRLKLVKGAVKLSDEEFLELLRSITEIRAATGYNKNVHAECRIIATCPNVNVIGVSKLCCTMCYLCIQALDIEDEIVGGLHGGIYRDWKLPELWITNYNSKKRFFKKFLGKNAFNILDECKEPLRNEILQNLNAYRGLSIRNAIETGFSSDSDVGELSEVEEDTGKRVGTRKAMDNFDIKSMDEDSPAVITEKYRTHISNRGWRKRGKKRKRGELTKGDGGEFTYNDCESYDSEEEAEVDPWGKKKNYNSRNDSSTKTRKKRKVTRKKRRNRRRKDR